MSDDASQPAAVYTSVQPSGGQYKSSSLQEGFTCSGIWAVLAAVFILGLQVWVGHSHPEKGGLLAVDWAAFENPPRAIHRDGYLYVVRFVLPQKEECHDIHFARLALVVGLLDSQSYSH
jgi:hypothetical protein